MEMHYYGLTAELYQAIVAIVEDRLKEIRVTREEYDRLVTAQGQVSEGLRRVEIAMARLAEAQARTEERVARLEEGQAAMQAAIERLTQAQRELTAAHKELAVAQLRTEASVKDMAAALEKLAQAQAHTDARVSSLGETLGFTMEDVARLMLPPYLQRHHGIRLEGAPGEELYRRFFAVADAPPVEINLYGEGYRDGQQVVVLGEAKACIGGGAVKEFADAVKLVEPFVTGEVWRVMFGYFIHPFAEEVAKKYGILLVASYQR